MNHIECRFKLSPFQPFNEIIVAQLSELEFESFTEEATDSLVKAYITEDLFNKEEVDSILNGLKELVEIEFSTQLIEKENWNKKWEENFDSVEVGQFCYVRAPFHEPKSEFEFEIIIEPKMSFGTGHHQTTQMMIEQMENLKLQNSAVLDMGSGTGILAILAKKMGAQEVDAIDIEDWAYENMKENFQRNAVEANAYLGDAEQLNRLNSTYQLILANINKNVLMQDFSAYDEVLSINGFLILSGFYQSDEEDLLNNQSLANYRLIEKKSKEGWSSLKLQKT